MTTLAEWKSDLAEQRGQEIVGRYIGHLEALEKKILGVKGIISSHSKMYGHWVAQVPTGHRNEYDSIAIENVNPKDRNRVQVMWETYDVRSRICLLEDDADVCGNPDGLSRNDPVYRFVNGMRVGASESPSNKIGSVAWDLMKKIKRREMDRKEYNSLLDETHHLVVAAKEFIEKRNDWVKDDKSVYTPPQKPGEPTNSVEERPSILFGDSTEYKEGMSKLAERFGGR